MRICIINEFFWPDSAGGTGTVLSDLARALRQNYEDVEIDVITSRNLYRLAPPAGASPSAASAGKPERPEKAMLPATDTWHGMRIIRLATPRPNGLSTPMRLLANLSFTFAAFFQLLRSKRYDLVLVATAPPMVAIAASAYRSLTGTPYIYTVYDLEPDRAVVLRVLPESHPAVKLLRSGQKRWLSSAAKVVVLGRCMQSFIERRYGLPPGKVAVIPVGADPDEIVPLGRQTRFRDAYGLKGFVLLYSGNFGRYHDFDTVLKAAKRLGAQRDDIHFVLVGSGWQRDSIQKRIESESLGNVLLRPFVPKDDYADLLASADASLVTLEPGMDGLCVPSKFYSILASGRATLAVVPPTMEVGLTIEESQSGVRIDHGDVDALVAAVLQLADDVEGTARMGENARKALVEKYSTAVVAQGYYRAFLEATEKRPESVVKLPGEPVLRKAAEAMEETEALREV